MDLRNELFALLAGEAGPPQFFCAGTLVQSKADLALEVAGVGPVRLPLDAAGAAALKPPAGPAAMAPFGRGEETVTDESVRHTWQLEPGQFTLSGKGECRCVTAACQGSFCGSAHDAREPCRHGKIARDPNRSDWCGAWILHAAMPLVWHPQTGKLRCVRQWRRQRKPWASPLRQVSVEHVLAGSAAVLFCKHALRCGFVHHLGWPCRMLQQQMLRHGMAAPSLAVQRWRLSCTSCWCTSLAPSSRQAV